MEIFDRDKFGIKFQRIYAGDEPSDNSFKCLLYLILAVGLVLAAPAPDSDEHKIINQLSLGDFDQAEAFYQSAQKIRDPYGFSWRRETDIQGVQALALMVVYNLVVSRRNDAHMDLGEKHSPPLRKK
jgi:hypothetical protein